MSSRFARVGAPAQPPGCCISCRRGSDPLGFFDLGTMVGLDVAGDQVAYLCISGCLLELVRNLGYTPPEALSRMQQVAGQLQQRANRQAAEVDSLERVVVGETLAMIERITMARLNREMEGHDAGPDAGDPAAGGGGDGLGADAGGADAGEPAEPDSGAAAGPGPVRRGRAKRPPVGAGAGPAGDG